MGLLRTKRCPSKYWIFGLLVLSACYSQVQPNPTKVPNITQTLVLEEISSQTPVLKPSLARKSTPSTTPTMAQSPMVTSMPTTSSTIIPSLEPTQAFEAIQKFRNEGMDCQIPCFFGIIPEQTTFDQAVGIFNWLNHPLIPLDASKPEFYYSDFYGNDLGLSVILEKEKNYVKNLRLRISLKIAYKGGTAYPQISVWQAFSPDTLITKYGSPSKVDFRLHFPTEELFSKTAYYDMRLYFAYLDFTIAFESGVVTDGTLINVCPLSDQFSSFEIWFGKEPAYQPPPGIPLEKATSLTLHQFSSLISQKEGSTCFFINPKAFNQAP